MRKRIETRLQAAQRKLSESRMEIAIVQIMGGVVPGDPIFARFGDLSFIRDIDESFAAFKVRVMCAAKDQLATHVVFGGLPSSPEECDAAMRVRSLDPILSAQDAARLGEPRPLTSDERSAYG